MANPNEELLRALDNLDAYVKQASKSISRYEEIKDMLQVLFFSEYRKEKEHQEISVKKELVKSVGLVKKYLPLIEKYSHGSPEEKRFAETVQQTIQRYNDAVKNQTVEEDRPKLTIDTTHSIAYQKSGNPENAKIQKLFLSKNQPKTPPSQLEVDTLKLKAIRLIEDEPSFQQALLETLKEKDSVNSEEIENDGKMVTLMQTWSALPGEVHRIVGAFKRESERSIPIKDSFKVFLESKQTGHPYPAQHMGWALSHWLIPISAIWIDSIPLLLPILERKKEIAKSLLPKGEKNLKARNLYRIKKQLFEEGRLEFLTFHQELAHAIVKSSSFNDEIKSYGIINHFYEQLIQEPFPFAELSRVNDEMNHIFIDAPFDRIEEIRLEGDENNLFEKFDQERSLIKTAWKKASRSKTPFEKSKKAYLNLMGSLIGDASALLLKLHLSEKLGEKPPPLSDFEMKIQATAFKHLLEFIEELEEPANLEDLHEQGALKLRMKMEIQSEIELFSAPTFEEIDPFLQELTEETISYFHARYHSK